MLTIVFTYLLSGLCQSCQFNVLLSQNKWCIVLLVSRLHYALYHPALLDSISSYCHSLARRIISTRLLAIDTYPMVSCHNQPIMHNFLTDAIARTSHARWLHHRRLAMGTWKLHPQPQRYHLNEPLPRRLPANPRSLRLRVGYHRPELQPHRALLAMDNLAGFCCGA